MIKRFSAVLLCVCMLIAMLPATAFAAGEYKLTMTDQTTVEGIINTSARIGSDYYPGGSSVQAEEGTRVLLYCDIEEGYLFQGWNGKPAGTAEFKDIRNTFFDMPASDLTLSANVKKLEPDVKMEDGVLTWKEEEGFLGKVEVAGFNSTMPFTEAENGVYTFDIDAVFKNIEQICIMMGLDSSYLNGTHTLNIVYGKEANSYDTQEQGRINNVATFSYTTGQLTKLGTPENLNWKDFTATWDAVDNAGRYNVTFYETIDGNTGNYGNVTVTGTSCDLTQVTGKKPKEAATYTFTVQALCPENNFDYLPGDVSASSASSAPWIYPVPQTPDITASPQQASYAPGDTAQPLTVEASVDDGGTLSYQWYSNTSDSSTGGTVISDATDKTYISPTDNGGDTWYYCQVTNNNNGKTSVAVTAAAKIHVHLGGTANCHEKAICSECNQEYGDIDLNTHVWEDDFTVDKEPTCTETGRKSIHCRYDDAIRNITWIDPLGHSFTNYIYNNDATCTFDGTETAKCDRGCGKTDIRTAVGTATGHKAEEVAAKDPTCTEDGNIAYWYCSVCDKYFSDKECEDEIKEKETVIEATGHKAEEVAAKDPTCTEDGNIAYWHCSACDKYFSDKECENEIEKEEIVILAEGHGKIVTEGEKAPTCTSEGYTGNKVCGKCGEIIQEGTAIPKLAHDYKDGKCTLCGAADPDYQLPDQDGGDIDNPDQDGQGTEDVEDTSKTDDDADDTEHDAEDTVPKTGDIYNLFMWILLAVAGSAAAGKAACSRRK